MAFVDLFRAFLLEPRTAHRLPEGNKVSGKCRKARQCRWGKQVARCFPYHKIKEAMARAQVQQDELLSLAF
jgi:hypothetical protein